MLGDNDEDPFLNQLGLWAKTRAPTEVSALLLVARETLVDTITVWQEYGGVAAEEERGGSASPWSARYGACLARPRARFAEAVWRLQWQTDGAGLDVAAVGYAETALRGGGSPGVAVRATIRYLEHRLATVDSMLATAGERS